MLNTRLSGGTLVFIGAFLWSLNSPLVKFLTLDPMLICGLRSIIAATALCVFIKPRRLHWNVWMLVYVLSYTALCLSIILALTMTSAPVAIGMQYTAIIWLFLANLVLKRHFNIRAFVPVCVIFLGVVFFMLSSNSGSNNAGNLIALSEGVFFACMTVSSKKVSGSNPIGLVAVGNLFAGVSVMLLFPGVIGTVAAMTRLDWFVMVVLGVLQIGAGYGFYNMGVQKTTPQRASTIALWEMILGPVWVAIFLGEYPSLMVVTGFLIVMAGIFLDVKLNPAPMPLSTVTQVEK